jgi:hypothetical protein
MIFEVLSVYFVVLCNNMLFRLIDRRHDVLYYVSRPNPD